MVAFPFPVRELDSYRYVAEGPQTDVPPIVLLHGMLGHLSNWTSTIEELPRHGYHVIAPVLPVYDLPLRNTTVTGLAEYLHGFLDALGVGPVVLVGNSLGGHVALLYALEHPDRTEALVLSGSSGIYEVHIGTSTPRRYDPQFIREKAALTFYDPIHVTDELIAEMGEIIANRGRTLRLIRMARATRDEAVTPRLHEIEAPTLLVWGKDDEITPRDVAEEFRELLPHAELYFVDECGHAPMIEQPEAFNRLTLDFLRRVIGEPEAVPVSTPPS